MQIKRSNRLKISTSYLLVHINEKNSVNGSTYQMNSGFIVAGKEHKLKKDHKPTKQITKMCLISRLNKHNIRWRQLLFLKPNNYNKWLFSYKFISNYIYQSRQELLYAETVVTSLSYALPANLRTNHFQTENNTLMFNILQVMKVYFNSEGNMDSITPHSVDVLTNYEYVPLVT